MRREAGAERLPGWIHLLLGLVTVGIGAYVFFRPFSSLSLLMVLIAAGLFVVGLSRLTGAHDNPGVASRVLGMMEMAVGIAVLVWPGTTVRFLVVALGVWLVVDGIVDIVSGFRRSRDERLASVLTGAASVLFGVLSLTWPDITILVLALVFAAKLVLFGINQIVAGLRRQPEGEDDEKPRSRWRRSGRLAGAVLALLVALGLAGVSSQWRNGELVVDDFYTAPDDVPAVPGTLVRSEDFSRDIPDGARAWRILYSTTRAQGVPAVASGLVVVPERSAGPLPVIAWAHGTTGVAQTCAPSILPAGLESGAFFSLDRVIEEGWALVATDYVGLGTAGPHPYLIGQGEGRSVLDAVRAAHQIEGVDLENRTVVWGHSQGGHAALWTGVLAPEYAPDTNVIGIAALAPASDPVGLLRTLRNLTGGNVLAAYAVSAYAAAYPDVAVADYVAPGGEVTVAAMAGRCLGGDPGIYASLISSIAVDWSLFPRDLTAGPLGARFAANVPPYRIEAPLLVGQGGDDGLVTPEVQRDYVDGLCAAGRQVDYRLYEGSGHVELMEPDSPLIPDLVDWTHARLAGTEPISTCDT